MKLKSILVKRVPHDYEEAELTANLTEKDILLYLIENIMLRRAEKIEEEGI